MPEIRIMSRTLADTRLCATAFMRPLRAGEQVFPVPFFNLHRPVGDLLRAGHDRAQDRIRTLLAERTAVLRAGGERRTFWATIRTPAGVVRLTTLTSHDIGVRLTIAPDVWMTSGELVLKGVALPDVAQAAIVGHVVDEFVPLPSGHALSGLAIANARMCGTSIRLRLDMPEDELRLAEIGEDPQVRLEMTRREALALAA